jgi:hypothetical protein
VTEVDDQGNFGTPREIPYPDKQELIFQVNSPLYDGVAPHPGATGDVGFGKIIDLEGNDFYGSLVDLNLSLLGGRRLGVSAGQLYTHELTPDELDLLTWTNLSDVGTVKKELGQLAQEIGLNIACQPNSTGIEIMDASGKVVERLSPLKAGHYEIRVDNDCGRESEENAEVPQPQPPVPEPEVGSDFRFYYQVIQLGRNNEKFDLRAHVEPGDPPPTPGPGICETSFLSKTRSLGLTWP